MSASGQLHDQVAHLPGPRSGQGRAPALIVAHPGAGCRGDILGEALSQTGREQVRVALDAGADPATVAGWITEAERVQYKAVQRAKPEKAARMSRDEIVSVVTAQSDLLAVLREADPADKAECGQSRNSALAGIW